MSTTNGDAGEPRDQLPPSAKFVLDVLEQEEQVKRQELIERTGLSKTTIWRVTKQLQNEGYLSKTRANDDVRQVVFILESTHGYNMTER